MFHLKWIEIDLSAIKANTRWVLSRLNPGVKLMAVVKADAYGCGAVSVAKAALECGAESLGVLNVEEARALREARIKAPIHLLAPILPEQAPEVARLGLTATIDDLAQAKALAKAVRGVIEVHVDLDFGLGRWGLPASALENFTRALKPLKKLRLAGLSAHIDYVSGKNAVEAEEKLGKFSRLSRNWKTRFPKLVCHAANSSILLDFPHWQMDLARIGNLLYGVPSSKIRPAQLKNPWKFYGRIIALKKVAKGKAIGYASEYLAPRRMTVATVPAGYADGLTMEPAERLIGFGSGFSYWGKLKGQNAPFIGRCGISHILLDVSAIPSARVGDAVSLPVRRTAASPRLKRLYV